MGFRLLLTAALVQQGISTGTNAKKARALATESYEDAQGAEMDIQTQQRSQQQQQQQGGQQQVFLATSQQAQSNEILMRSSEAVLKNSQALMVLESEQEQLSQREAAFEAQIYAKVDSAAKLDSSSAIVVNSTQETPQDFGDLTCMRFTGGSCAVFSCKSERGPTICENGLCMCDRGCANSEGICEGGAGKWIGSYSIMFKNPYNRAAPYIGVHEDPDTWNTVKGSGATLTASAESQPEWKVALTPQGRVRFESVSMPGHVLQLYNNRRRREYAGKFLLEKKVKDRFSPTDPTDVAELQGTIQEETSTIAALETKIEEDLAMKQKSGFPDDDDIWPVVVPLGTGVSPLDSTFRIRPTHQDGGGLEIWDPQTGHALSSANKEDWFGDHVAEKGIAECAAGSFSTTNCEGRHLVEFKPALPYEATPIVAREYIKEIDNLTWWQSILLVICLCMCCAGCAVLKPGSTSESALKEATPQVAQNELQEVAVAENTPNA